MNDALTRQVGGDHYRTMAIGPAEFCYRNRIGKLEGDAIAYLCRWRAKGGLDDLRKAIHTIELIIAFEGTDEEPEGPVYLCTICGKGKAKGAKCCGMGAPE